MIKTTKKLRAVGYPRVSGETQGNSGYSLADQVKSIEAFCLANNIELVAHYTEVESAATMHKRPAFKAALRHVYSSDIDCIVFNNLDRYSRDSLGAELIRRSMKKRGKKLISVQESYLTPVQALPGADDDGADDYLEAAIQHRMVEAEQERKRIVKRLKKGRIEKISRGGWPGHRPPFEADVIAGELVLNPVRARIVRHIVRLRKLKHPNGEHVFTYKQIANYLNGENDLIDPATGEVGRRFERYFDRPMKQKRIKKRIQNNLWNVEGVRRIYLDCIEGIRNRWFQKADLAS